MVIQKGSHSFFIENANRERIAYIEYSFEDETTLIANSTFVDSSLRGQGIAQKLLEELANYARDNGYKIRPLCSYVVNAFEKSDAYDDVKV
ncbi:MAG: GNAT family N-acetyltransferase [Candidatus Izemoplasmataceae bacterium]